MSKPVLYSYFRSSASWRVRIALAYKGIDFEYKAVSLIKDGGQQNSDDYRNINPMTQVPSLVIDGAVLTQSLPIIEYLEETRPGRSLLPKDPVQRAQARRVAEIVNAGIQPIQNLPVLQHLASWCGDEKKMEWAHHWIHRGFVGLEKTLEPLAGRFCVGDDITIADLALVPQVYNAHRFPGCAPGTGTCACTCCVLSRRFKVDMSEFPIISRVHAALNEEPAFKAAHPSKQPDCPEDLK